MRKRYNICVVVKLSVENIGRSKHLIGTSEKGGDRIDLGMVVPLERLVADPMAGRQRFLKGSLMTGQQAADEEYQKKNRIA